MRVTKVWVVDDDSSIRWVLEKALQGAGMDVESFEDGQSVLNQLDITAPDVLISDVRMPGMDGLSLLERVRKEAPSLPCIIMTAHSDLESAVAAYEGGAFEYLPKPFDVDESIELVKRAIKLKAEEKQPAAVAADMPNDAPTIIGEAPAMQEVFRAIGRLSRSHMTVLITGESGTGKELVAQALHQHSPRNEAPFIALNTAAIPKDLLESELFGHEKGAFTGATTQRKGRFEQADGGTLFLDEIGDMPADLQTRLLRVLADGEFYRVGGHIPVKVNVRIIAATHQHLEEHTVDGRFREDLFHRLNVIRIQLPALRERRSDIPLLLNFFLNRVATELKVEAKKLRPAAEQCLTAHDWPGNVRQLENICRWLTVMAAGRDIYPEDLPPEFQSPQPAEEASDDASVTEATAATTIDASWEELLRHWASDKLAQGNEAVLDDAVPMFEKVMIEVALEKSNGHRQDAAKLLGWGRNTLTRKIQQLGME